MPESPTRPIVYLEGERLYCRPRELSDLHCMQRWINDPGTRKNLLSFRPFSEIAERKFIEELDRDDRIALMIVLREGDRAIGSMSLMDIRWKDRVASFGIMIGEPECRGKGYGTEATRMMLRYAFETANLNRVRLGVYDFNIAGIAVYENVGFVREGVEREHSFIDGRYVDHFCYAMLARDYFKTKA